VDSYKADIARLEHKLNAALAEASEFSTKLFEVSAKLGETEEVLASIKEDKEGLETSLSAIQQEKADVQVRGSDVLAFSLGLGRLKGSTNPNVS
jgi:chromosome segregation ATPase